MLAKFCTRLTGATTSGEKNMLAELNAVASAPAWVLAVRTWRAEAPAADALTDAEAVAGGRLSLLMLARYCFYNGSGSESFTSSYSCSTSNAASRTATNSTE